MTAAHLAQFGSTEAKLEGGRNPRPPRLTMYQIARI